MYIILTSQKQLEKDTVREVLYSKSKVNANVPCCFSFTKTVMTLSIDGCSLLSKGLSVFKSYFNLERRTLTPPMF